MQFKGNILNFMYKRKLCSLYWAYVVILCLTKGCLATESPPVHLYSLFSWGNLKGNITFSWGGHGTEVIVEVGMEYADTEMPEEPKEFDWAIHENPIRFDLPERCDRARVGKKLLDLSSILGKLTMHMNANQIFKTDQLAIVGINSFWGRSVVINSAPYTTCGNIQGVGGEVTYEARFHSPIGGSIWFRSWSWDLGMGDQSSNNSGTEIIIISDIFNTLEDELKTSSHDWNLYITDILDDESAQYRTSCNFLTSVYDPSLKTSCDENGCPEGDLTSKHGKVVVSSTKSKLSQRVFHSSGNPLPSVSGARQLYVGIEDTFLRNSVYACARLKLLKTKRAKSFFNSGNVSGEIVIEQASVFTPTELTLDLHNLQEKAGGFHVHELPVEQALHSVTAREESVTAREESVTAREESITAREESITAREESITAREESISAREESVTAREESVTARNESVTARNESVTAGNESVTAREESVTARGESVTVREESVLAREESVTVREESVTVSEESVTASEESVTAREESVTAREESVTAKEESVRAREESVTAREEGL